MFELCKSGCHMSKDVNYKEIANNSFEDKVNNIVFIMKFLDERGGLNLVKEYFANAVPTYIIEFEGFGGAKKWVIRQWIRANPHGFLQKIGEQVKKDSGFLKQKFELIEDTKDCMVSKVNCKYMRSLVKKGKKYKCDFDMREYYCQNACIPLLSKIVSDIYLTFNAELTPDGCIQTIKMDKSALSKDEKEKNEPDSE